MADTILKQLLESGAHFGHQTRRWNPKMQRYIFGVRGGVHIIDLTKTAVLLEQAAGFARSTTENGGKILFVATKRQGRAIVKDEATQAGMPYVTERWLGGMLTNYATISGRIRYLRKIEVGLESGDFAAKYNKKEQLDFANELEALNRIFGGIKNMDGLPAALFVLDGMRDGIAIAEARTLGIPVIGVADTNIDPDLLDYIIPANDDAIKSIRLITHTIGAAAAAGAATYIKSAKERAERAEVEAEAAAVAKKAEAEAAAKTSKEDKPADDSTISAVAKLAAKK